jgi:hypothetical protein
VLFQREDMQAGPDPNAGPFTGVRNPSRIELVPTSGWPRRVLTDCGHHPSPSPHGSEIVFVRLSSDGAILMAHGIDSGEDRTLVKPGMMPDLAYPPYSPDGTHIAFAATSPLADDHTSARSWLLADWFDVQVADAHGFPWNAWLVNRDGSALRELAEVTEDDASLAWPGHRMDRRSS